MIIVEHKGMTAIVGALFAATAIVAYSTPVSGNDKVTIMLVGTLITLFVSESLKARIYGRGNPREDSQSSEDGDEARPEV